jgi:hypothetical protein
MDKKFPAFRQVKESSCPKMPVARFYLEPVKSTPLFYTLFPQNSIFIFSQVVSSLTDLKPKILHAFLLHVCYVSSHHIFLNLSI